METSIKDRFLKAFFAACKASEVTVPAAIGSALEVVLAEHPLEVHSHNHFHFQPNHEISGIGNAVIAKPIGYYPELEAAAPEMPAPTMEDQAAPNGGQCHFLTVTTGEAKQFGAWHTCCGHLDFQPLRILLIPRIPNLVEIEWGSGPPNREKPFPPGFQAVGPGDRLAVRIKSENLALEPVECAVLIWR